MKERATLTIEEELLKKVDSMVNGSTIKNRSHAVELLLMKALNEHAPKQAIILAGGKGTRLRPITFEIPKALIPVHDKTLTEHLFDLLKLYDVKEVIMAVGHMREKIKKHFGDGSKFGMRIKYAEETEPMGTAGPIRLARNLIKDTFIVQNGDELKNINISEMYAFHKENNALATIALTTIGDPSIYGVAKLDGSKIQAFVEKPEPGEEPSNLINSGFYILDPKVIDYIPDGYAMFEKDVFPKLAAEGKLYGYPFSGQWFDTGNIERYDRAIKEWKDII
ncbi:MAG: sugar phosphate nucleotidyltransferase [Nanoarchaeota archaeon]